MPVRERQEGTERMEGEPGSRQSHEAKLELYTTDLGVEPLPWDPMSEEAGGTRVWNSSDAMTAGVNSTQADAV